MQWMELTSLWQALAQWLETHTGRLPLPRTRTILAAAIGVALLTLHTLTASAGPITIDPGTAATLLCQIDPCIGKVKIVPWGDNSGNQYVEFSFTTSIDATIVLAVSTQSPDSPVYYHEFAHVDAATMQLIPAKQHTLDLGVLKANTTYHYALIAVVDEQHRTRIEGTFKTGEPIDSDSHGNPISDE
jgi:hypothetical protein